MEGDLCSSYLDFDFFFLFGDGDLSDSLSESGKILKHRKGSNNETDYTFTIFFSTIVFCQYFDKKR